MFNILTTFVDLPSATQFIASTTDWSSPFFTAFLPFLYVIVGVGVFILAFKLISGIFHH